MKRTLLLSAAFLAATCSFAQGRAELKRTFDASQAAPSQKVLVKNTLPRLEKQNLRGEMHKGAKAPRRSASTGNYYALTGGLYEGFDTEGNGYGYTIYNMAPFVTYTAKSKQVVGNWHINGYDTQIQDSIFQTYNYPNTLSYAPTFVNKADSFNIGDNNLYGWYGYNGGSQYSSYAIFAKGIIGSDSVCCMYPADDHASYMYNNRAYSCTQNWGFLSTDNLFGTGTVESDGVTYTSYGMVQQYTALASPLYVESLALKGLSFSTTPVAQGDTLRAYIATADSMLDTLYCTAADVQPFTKDDYGRNSKTIYDGVLNFYKKTVDAFGNESIEPSVIPAGLDFEIYFTGFNKEGVDFGAEGLSVTDEDYLAGNAYVLVTDGTSAYTFGYQSALALNLAIVGQFDQALVLDNNSFESIPEGTMMNALSVSKDGQTCTTYGQTSDGDYNMGCIMVGTANPWFDNEGESNYEMVSDDNTDWITQISINTAAYDNYESNWYGYNAISVVCEALPDGVSGRSAKVQIKGHGVVSDYFYIYQGDADTPTPEDNYYTRVVTGKTWGTLLLPFEVSSNSDFQYYTISNFADNKLYLEKVSTVDANVPCIYKKLNSSVDTLKIAKGTIQGSETTTPSTTIIAFDGNIVDLVGTYTSISVAPTDQNGYLKYYFSNNALYWGEKAFTVDPNKAYIVVHTTSADKAPAKTVTLVDETETAIATLTTDASAKSTAVYNLQGQRLSAPMVGQVNIINGKKLLVK